MNDRANDHVTLLGVALAGAVSMAAGEGDWQATSSLIGGTLILILVTYEPPGVGGNWLRGVSWGAVLGLCLILVAGPFI